MSIRRRPSAATVVAVLVTLAIGTQASFAAPSNDRGAPDPVRAINVVGADATSVTVAWHSWRDDGDVAGYGVYVNGVRRETVARDSVRRVDNNLALTISDLDCGTGYTVGLDVYDDAGKRSPQTSTTVSTAACPDRTPPSAPGGVRQVAASETSVVLAWTPSTDSGGVVEYGLYLSGLKVGAVSEPSATVPNLECGKAYSVAIDAADAAGNRSAQATALFSTAACVDRASPSSPTNLKVTGATPTGISLSWTASRDDVGVTGYGLYLGGQKVGTSSSTSTTFDGLRCSNTYTLAVDAADRAGHRSNQSSVTAATSSCDTTKPSSSGDTTPPSAPPNLRVASATQTQVVIRWDPASDSKGVVNYRIYRDGSYLGQGPGSSGGLTDQWTDRNRVCGTSSQYAVEAQDAAGNTGPRSTITASTGACSQQTPPPPPPSSGDTTPPSAPPNLRVASATQTQVVIRWDPASDSKGVVNYRIYRDGSYLGQGPGSSGGLTDQWTDRNRVCGTSSQYAVEAQDAAGNTGPRSTITASTGACSQQTPPPPPPSSGDTTPPSAPPNLRVASATQTQVGIRWDPATDDKGVVNYRVFRDGGNVAQVANASSGWMDSNRACGSLYQYGVDAQDAAGNTGPRSTTTAFTPPCESTDNTPPSAPTNLIASTRTATSITLTWTASNDDTAVAGYGLYRGGTRIGSASGTTGIFSGLTCGTSYTLAVDAYDVVGNDSAQAVVMVSTTSCADTQAPATPTGLKVSNVTQSGLTLAWSASSDNVGVTGYDVYRNNSKVTSGTVLSSSQTGLSCGTAYTLGVAARDAAGNTSPQAQMVASTASCSTTPPPPTTGGTLTGSQCNSRASVAGAVIENVTVSGGCSVGAANVTLRNVTATDITFGPNANGGQLLNSHVRGASIFGADNVLIQGNTIDCEFINKDGSVIWDEPAGNYPDHYTIRGNTYTRCHVYSGDTHSQAIYNGYARNGLIENNVFNNNGSTAHIFFTWWGETANPSTSYPRDICVRGNTFINPPGGVFHYYDINFRSEIPTSANIKIQPGVSNTDPRFYGTC